MGVSNAELWCNLALCCFYTMQYDLVFRCFDNALLVADDMTQADVWCDLLSLSWCDLTKRTRLLNSSAAWQNAQLPAVSSAQPWCLTSAWSNKRCIGTANIHSTQAAAFC